VVNFYIACKRLLVSGFLIVSLTGVLFTSAAEAVDMKAWQKELVTLIKSKQTYPRAALSKQIEGKAKIKITLDKSGNITNYEITEPTGEAALDDELPKLMERLDPMPALPASFAKDSLTFVLPISYRL